MKKLLTFILVSIFGWLGWAGGEKVGIMTAWVLSCIGSGVGIYAGWKLNRMFFE